MTKPWWKEAVVYQIYTRSFQDSNGDGIGDIPGILSRLDYLANLGVTVLWLNPVYDSPLDDNGYDISNYRALHPDYGTMSDWEHLLNEVHNRGMKLIMDLVINHTSDEHHWFKESRKGRENPYRDYYIWKDGVSDRAPNNWQSFFEGSTWTCDPETHQYFLHLFSARQPDLNWENPEVEREIFEMIEWWLEKGIDGFRMDVINLLKKPAGLSDAPGTPDPHTGLVLDIPLYANNPGMHDILKRLNKEVLSRYNLFTVGEVVAAGPDEAIEYVGADREELQMVIHFEIPMISREWTVPKLRSLLTRWYSVIEKGGWNANYLSNHDQPRQVSIYGNDTEYRVESAKLLGLLNHLLPGTPFIHQGEEIGMTNGTFRERSDFRDISALRSYDKRVQAGESPSEVIADLQKYSRDNGRLPMQWDASDHAGFTSGEPWIPVNGNYPEINVALAEQDSNSVLNFYRNLILLRKEHPVFVYGDFDVVDDIHESVFSFTRTLEEERVLVLLNMSASELNYDLPDRISTLREIVISNYTDTHFNDGRIGMRPYEAILVQIQITNDTNT